MYVEIRVTKAQLQFLRMWLVSLMQHSHMPKPEAVNAMWRMACEVADTIQEHGSSWPSHTRTWSDNQCVWGSLMSTTNPFVPTYTELYCLDTSLLP